MNEIENKIGMIGCKRGMTRLFTSDGLSIPVTVIEVISNRIIQLKTTDIDGYSAVQVTTGSKKVSRVTKSEAGHFAKAKSEAGRGVWEFRVSEQYVNELKLGQEIALTETLVAGQKIDVTGWSKGKGFQGGIKRWNFNSQDATHGNSLSHRSNGSIGMCQTPGKVFKGKKMSGHMGAERKTVQNLEIVKVDSERNFVLVKGAVPGSNGADVLIKPAVKASSQRGL